MIPVLSQRPIPSSSAKTGSGRSETNVQTKVARAAGWMLVWCMASGLSLAQGAEPLFVLEGQDARSGSACALYVWEEAPTSTENSNLPASAISARVSTSYQHDQSQPDVFSVSPHPTRQDVWAGTGANGRDQLIVAVPGGATSLRQAVQASLRWWHVDHFHNYRCNNLQLVNP